MLHILTSVMRRMKIESYCEMRTNLFVREGDIERISLSGRGTARFSSDAVLALVLNTSAPYRLITVEPYHRVLPQGENNTMRVIPWEVGLFTLCVTA